MNALRFLIFLAFILTSGVFYSQNYESGTLVDNSEKTYNGKFLVDNENKLLRYRDRETSRVFGFNQIKNLTIASFNVAVINIEKEPFLLSTLVNGKASLYQKDNTSFYLKKADSDWVLVNTSVNKNNVPGMLNLVFDDCGSIRETIARTNKFDKNSLIKLTGQYNNCDYSKGFELTQKEIESSNSFKSDVYWLYAGAGVSINNLSFRNTEETFVLPQVSFGIFGSPGFLKSLQNKLYLSTDISYGISDSKTISADSQILETKIRAFLYTFEMQYNFNTANKLQPFAGGGLNFHVDRFKGNLSGERFKSTDGAFDLSLKAGLMYNSDKQKLVISFRYIPEYNSNATFKDSQGAIVPLQLKNKYFITRLEFYF